MSGIFHRPAGLSVLAFMLAATLPAYAQQDRAGAPPPPQQMGGPGQGPGEWTNDNVNRQQFREEMERIRKEHEEIEADEDKLLDKCVNVSSAQAAQCQQEKQALHERREKLHERMHALHEKMEAERKEHQEERQEHREEHSKGQPAQQPSHQPPPGPPPAQ